MLCVNRGKLQDYCSKSSTPSNSFFTLISIVNDGAQQGAGFKIVCFYGSCEKDAMYPPAVQVELATDRMEGLWTLVGVMTAGYIADDSKTTAAVPLI